MGIFGFGKNEEEKKEENKEAVEKTDPAKTATKKRLPKEKKSAPVSHDLAPIENPGSIVRNPRITEKATVLSEAQNAYSFDVAPNANKNLIARAIKTIYNVIPEKIRTINVASKTRFVRGRTGSVPGGKKAIVYLKKGDKIETN